MSRSTQSCLVAIIICTAVVSAKIASTRITGGTVTTIDKVPYLMQLRDDYGDVFCGGTLVSPDYVITAAHCFGEYDYTKTTVVGGASRMSEEGVQRKIASVTIHPEYDLYTKHSDAAVIKLDRPMSGKDIVSISLCRQPLKERDLVQVSGWGRSGFYENWDRQLRTVRFPVTSQKACRDEFGSLVEKNMFCASGLEAKGICFGDSGGPAVYGGELCGIVAMAYRCGEVGYSSGFTDVFALRPFLENAMRE